MKFKFSIFIVASILLVSTVARTFALTVPVLQDTSSSAASAVPLAKQPQLGVLTTKDGTATSLTVGDHQVALLKFDISNLDVVPSSINPGNISSALLRLYIITANPPGNLNIFLVTGTWNETFTATTEPLPTIDSTNTLAIIPSQELPTATKGFVSVDITAAVVNALQSGSNLSIAIETPTQGAKVQLGSKDGPSVGYGAEIDIQAVEPTLAIGAVTSGTAPRVTLTGSSPNQTINFTMPYDTFTIGTVTSGTAPGVTLTGTGLNQTLNLTLPFDMLTIGTVTSGTAPAVTLTGDAPNQSLNFVVPANTLTVGAVTMSGTAPTATLTGSAPNQILNLTLPQPVVCGDGSAGNYTATSGTLSVSNPQFASFVVPAGVTLHIPCGTTIRCTGSFANLGTIVVDPPIGSGSNVAVFQKGIAMALPGGSSNLYWTNIPPIADGINFTQPQVFSGTGGVAYSSSQLKSITSVALLYGGGGGIYGLGNAVNAWTAGPPGGGACRIIAYGQLLNSGTISARGVDGPSSQLLEGTYSDGAGGGGGGILILTSGTSITQNGVIDASGGNGGNGVFSAAASTLFGGGGGGGGGLIRLIAPVVTVMNGAQNLVLAGIEGTTPTGTGTYSTITGSGGGATAGNGGDAFGNAGTPGMVLTDQCNPAGLLGN